nr:MAG TPA: hypothetical protein [Caudoviricetes sp.]
MSYHSDRNKTGAVSWRTDLTDLPTKDPSLFPFPDLRY